MHGEGDRSPTVEVLSMIIPVRCFTCGNPIGHRWEEFQSRTKSGENPKKVLDSMGLRKYCCRRILLSHVDLIDEILLYSQKTEATQKRKNA